MSRIDFVAVHLVIIILKFNSLAGEMLCDTSVGMEGARYTSRLWSLYAIQVITQQRYTHLNHPTKASLQLLYIAGSCKIARGC